MNGNYQERSILSVKASPRSRTNEAHRRTTLMSGTIILSYQGDGDEVFRANGLPRKGTQWTLRGFRQNSLLGMRCKLWYPRWNVFQLIASGRDVGIINQLLTLFLVVRGWRCGIAVIHASLAAWYCIFIHSLKAHHLCLTNLFHLLLHTFSHSTLLLFVLFPLLLELLWLGQQVFNNTLSTVNPPTGTHNRIFSGICWQRTVPKGKLRLLSNSLVYRAESYIPESLQS